MNLNVELRRGKPRRARRAAARTSFAARLAVAQVAIALVLLVGAGLLFASFRAVLRLDLGFDPENVLTAAVALPGVAISRTPPSLVTFEQRALAAIRALPEVEAAGTTSAVPFSGNVNNSVILAEGYVMKPGEIAAGPIERERQTGLFRGDARRSSCAAASSTRATRRTRRRRSMIDDRLARKFWPDQDPVGRRLYRPADPSDLTKITPQTQFFTIVGVIRRCACSIRGPT